FFQQDSVGKDEPAMIVYLILLGVLILVFPTLRRNFRRIRHMKRLSAAIPGDEGYPFFGNIFEFEIDPQVMPHILAARINKLVKDTGLGLMKTWFFLDNVYFSANGETLKHTLDSNEEITKGEEYDAFVPWLGRGLITSTGDKWRGRRKMLTPTFHFSMLEGYVTTMNRHARICVDLLEQRAGHKLDMYQVVKMCALDIICETAMGKDLEAQRQPKQPYVAAIGDLITIATDITMKIWLRPRIIRQILGLQQKFDRSLVIAHNFTNDVISERSDALRKGEVEPTKRAFLDTLLEQRDKQGLSDEDIQEEVNTFMFAGHDTTSAGMGWAIWCMACNPDIQDRAYREIVDVLGEEPDRDLTREDMGKLIYLDRCIKESMRLYPPVPFVGRQLQNDFHCGEYLLPRKAAVSISPFLVHRNESIYPNAAQYDPDRFLPEVAQQRHAFDYIPFSAGPRNCIGQKFAQYEEKIIMSWLLRRFRFESDE
ncbi:hypothetical protein PENTCL1PPCAC_14170, partial [Pristionchus entomophagus]